MAANEKVTLKKLKIFFALSGLMMLAALEAAGGEVKVIANKEIQADTISADEIRSVFLEESIRFAGKSVEPVLEESGPVRDAFLNKYMGKNAEELATYYRTLIFTGRGSMPKTLGSDAEVVAYVAKTRGAIGYVDTTSSAEGVKTLAVLSEAKGGERTLITHIDPEYPQLLRERHIGGTVRLQLTITPKGSVEDISLLGGNPILGEQAMAAVKRWVYAPSHGRTTTQVSIPFDPER
jgi:TonB family protein